MAVLVVWYASGVGYVASILMAPQNAMTAAVATVMIMGGFLNGVQPRYVSLSPFMKRAVGERSGLAPSPSFGCSCVSVWSISVLFWYVWAWPRRMRFQSS